MKDEKDEFLTIDILVKKQLDKLQKEIDDIKRQLDNKDKLISNMRDVLFFCARDGVGTYYQQQSAREMLLHNKKITWSRYNPDGTVTDEWKAWVFQCSGQDGLDDLLEEERILKGGRI